MKKQVIIELKLILLLLVIFQFSCNKENQKIKTQKKEFVREVDTLDRLLEIAKEVDTLEYTNREPFWFIKTGKLYSETDKSTIVVNCPTDSTYKIRLYTKIGDNWFKNDELNNLDFFPSQYEVLIADYNFDGFIDIYLNSTSSLGWSLSRGHLLTINPSTRKFEKHMESRNLANMFPDKKTKTIYTDSVENNPKGKEIWNLIYKWKNGKLKYANKKIKTQIE